MKSPTLQANVISLQFKDTDFHKLIYTFSVISIKIQADYFGKTE